MDDFVLWWFENVSYPFDAFVGDNIKIYCLVIFTIVCAESVNYFSRKVDRFTTVMLLSISLGLTVSIFWFWFVMFFPFFLVVFAATAAFVWICRAIYDSVRGKGE